MRVCPRYRPGKPVQAGLWGTMRKRACLFTHLEEVSSFQDPLDVLLGDQRLAGVGVVQESVHGLGIDSFDNDPLLILLL